MYENALTEQTLLIAEEQGYEAAYQFLLLRRQQIENRPSLYYFLGCLGCGAGRVGEARLWLGKGISALGYWYRPEMLDDEDLAPLFEDACFLRLSGLSRGRWEAARRQAQPLCTWRKKTADTLLVALHGNGQNARIALEDWAPLAGEGVQLEAVQSPTVDCCESYRWDGAREESALLTRTCAKAAAARYRRVCWSAFSAGCDALLRCVAFTDFSCDTLLLHSPWTPVWEQSREDVCRALARKQIETLVLCGEEDQDCREMARSLNTEAARAGARIRLVMLPGLRHQIAPELASLCAATLRGNRARLNCERAMNGA